MRRLLIVAALLALTATTGSASSFSSSAVPKRLFARAGSVYAALTYLERKRDLEYELLRMKVGRAGRTVVDGAIANIGCRECATFRPVALHVRSPPASQIGSSSVISGGTSAPAARLLAAPFL
jgi:hypothetical protein